MPLTNLMQQQRWTPEQVSAWVNTQSPETIRSAMGQYGVTPAELTDVYNVGAGTAFTPAQTRETLGMAPTVTPLAPAPTVTPTALSNLMQQQGWTPEQVSAWVNTQSPETIRSAMEQYGVTPEELTDVYNIGAGTAYTPEQARRSLGIAPIATPRLEDFTDQQIADWINTGPSKEEIRAILERYDIPLEDFVTRVNRALGTAYTPEAAERLLGYPQFEAPEMSAPATGRTGIWGEDPLAEALLPLITETARGLPQLAADLPQTLTDRYAALMGQALGPQALQGTLNQLAARNILGSSVAAEALAQAAVPIAQDIGRRGFEAQLAGQQLQMGVPGQLGNLLSALAQRETVTADPWRGFGEMMNLVNMMY